MTKLHEPLKVPRDDVYYDAAARSAYVKLSHHQMTHRLYVQRFTHRDRNRLDRLDHITAFWLVPLPGGNAHVMIDTLRGPRIVGLMPAEAVLDYALRYGDPPVWTWKLGPLQKD